MTKGILVVLTNTNSLQKSTTHTTETDTHKTGFDIREVAYIWRAFHSRKMHTRLTFATPSGGEAPVAPRSLRDAEKDEAIRDFVRDRALLDHFKNTTSLDSIKPNDYSVLLLPGCHGAMVDLPKSDKLAQILCSVYEEQNGVVASIGHGAAGLLNWKSKSKKNNGNSTTTTPTPNPTSSDYFISGKRITATTNEEEKSSEMASVLPYFLEDKLKERGAKFECKSSKEPFVIREERLITAQNTNSVHEWVRMVMETIEQKKDL